MRIRTGLVVGLLPACVACPRRVGDPRVRTQIRRGFRMPCKPGWHRSGQTRYLELLLARKTAGGWSKPPFFEYPFANFGMMFTREAAASDRQGMQGASSCRRRARRLGQPRAVHRHTKPVRSRRRQRAGESTGGVLRSRGEQRRHRGQNAPSGAPLCPNRPRPTKAPGPPMQQAHAGRSRAPGVSRRLHRRAHSSKVPHWSSRHRTNNTGEDPCACQSC